MLVILAQPRGFCAGVERPVEIVHKRVVERPGSMGATFVDELHEVPDGPVTVFSTHGLRDLPVIDATGPLAAKVRREGRGYAEKGFDERVRVKLQAEEVASCRYP